MASPPTYFLAYLSGGFAIQMEKMLHIDDDTTWATAPLPGLEIEIVHRRSRAADVEQISINLQALLSFEAFGGGNAFHGTCHRSRTRPRDVSHFSRVSLFDIHLWYMGAMAKTPETQLIEALKKVDVYGDIAPPYVQDPMTMVLRQNALQADLIRWDDSRARFVLTGTGRNRITARSRTSGKILRFKMRDEKDGRAPLRKA